MNKKDVKEGVYIHWVADRHFKTWNTYGKILKVTRKDVTIITFDDFKETTISLTGEALTDEISVVNKQTVEDYMESRKLKLTIRKSELDLEHKRTLRELDSQIINLNEATI